MPCRVFYDTYISEHGTFNKMYTGGQHARHIALGTQCIRPHSGVHAVGSGICLIVPALILEKC